MPRLRCKTQLFHWWECGIILLYASINDCLKCSSCIAIASMNIMRSINFSASRQTLIKSIDMLSHWQHTIAVLSVSLGRAPVSRSDRTIEEDCSAVRPNDQQKWEHYLAIVKRVWLTWAARRRWWPCLPHSRRRMTACKTTASWIPVRRRDRPGRALTDDGWRRLVAADEGRDRRDGCQLDRCRWSPVEPDAARRQHRAATAAVIPVEKSFTCTV